MATTTNTDNIAFINGNLSSDYPDLLKQWQKLNGRALAYGRDEKYKSFTKSWFENKNTNRVFREIRSALGALKEIENNNNLSTEEKEKIKSDIHLTIEAELCFLDLKQNIKLAKDEKQFRPEIEDLQLFFKSKTQAVRKIIAESSMPEKLKKNTASEIHQFYKRAKRLNLNFDNYIAYATTSKDIFELAHRAADMAEAASAGSMLTQAIPAVYAIIVASTFILDAARSWWNNQSPRKKALSTGLAAAAIGVIALSGALPAVGVFVVGALAVVGTFLDRVKPAIDLYRSINAKQKEVTATEDKIARLEQSNSLDLSLDQKDVTAIQRQLANYLAEHTVKPEEVNTLRELLSQPKVTIKDLATNTLLLSATNSQNADELKKFIINAASEHITTVKKDIDRLKSQRAKTTTLAGNGILSSVGAILCCIPTPPTIMAGIAILGLTTVVNVVTTYDLIPKAINFVKDLFNREKKVEPKAKPTDTVEKPEVKPKAKPTVAVEKSEYKPRPEMTNLHATLLQTDKQNSVPKQMPVQEPVAPRVHNKSGDLSKKPEPEQANEASKPSMK